MLPIERIIAESMADAERRGIQQGMLRGEYDRARKTALAMLKKGYPSEEVAEINDLPLEEVLELQKKTVH